MRRRCSAVRACVAVSTVLLVGACSSGHSATSPAKSGPTTTPSGSTPEVASAMPANPFASTSIWRRGLRGDTEFADVSAELLRDDHRPTRSGVDIVTICSTDRRGDLVAIERSRGWRHPQRATMTGAVQYRRRLLPDACTETRFNPAGNGLFVLYDPATETADLGVGGWRERGGPLLNAAGDGRAAHGLDVRVGDGIRGYGRASGLPALGGLLRSGELTSEIRHALAINVHSGMLSSARRFVWPASSADATASATYRGKDINLSLGTLLAVPPSVALDEFTWRTPQGRNVAVAAQRYGLYIVDTHQAPNLVQFAIEHDAARRDLGLEIDAATGASSVDPRRFDAEGFDRDVAQLFALIQAVTSNAPAS